MGIGSFISGLSPTTVISTIGGLGSTALDVWSAGRASDEASFNRDWQEHMSNTAYQRAVGDMRAAGINPMLAYMQGGASTPSGAVGDVPSIREPVGSALELKNKGIAGELMTSQSQAAQASADRDAAQADLTHKQQLLLEEQIPAMIRRVAAEASSAESLAKVDAAKVAPAQAEGLFWQKLNEDASSAKGVEWGVKSLVPLLKMIFGK